MRSFGDTREWAIWVAVSRPAQSHVWCGECWIGTDITRVMVDITGEEFSYRAIDISYTSCFRSPPTRGPTVLAASVPCLTIIPDLLKGDAADTGWCPTDTGREKPRRCGVTSQEHTARARRLLRRSPYTLVMQRSL